MDLSEEIYLYHYNAMQLWKLSAPQYKRDETERRLDAALSMARLSPALPAVCSQVGPLGRVSCVEILNPAALWKAAFQMRIETRHQVELRWEGAAVSHYYYAEDPSPVLNGWRRVQTEDQRARWTTQGLVWASAQKCSLQLLATLAESPPLAATFEDRAWAWARVERTKKWAEAQQPLPW